MAGTVNRRAPSSWKSFSAENAPLCAHTCITGIILRVMNLAITTQY